jgi:hypothetical protein
MDPATIITIANAAQLLSVAIDIAVKANRVLNTTAPETIEDELKRLEGARLRPSADIIAEADKASGRG